MAPSEAGTSDLEAQDSEGLAATSGNSTGSSAASGAESNDLWLHASDDSNSQEQPSGHFHKTKNKVNTAHHGALCQYCVGKGVAPIRQSLKRTL